MRINERSSPAFPAQQFVDRHTCLAAFDIPECLIYSADGIVQNRAVAPVRRVVHRFPEVFDRIRRSAKHERLEIAVYGINNEVRALGERGATVTIEPILVGENFDNYKAHASWFCCDDGN